MTTLPQDVEADLRQRIFELEQRLESALAERDEAVERQTATALVSFRLQNELRAGGDRQNASAEILRAIANTSGDAEHALQRIAETTARFFNAASVSIRIAEGNEWVQTVRVGASAQLTGQQPAAQLITSGKNLPATVYRENRQIHIPDLDNIDPSMASWPAVAARPAGIRTMSGTPLRRDGKSIGALIVYRDRLAPFTAEELALQQSFADQAVIAIENARLFNETKEALERQTATSDILKVIASSPSDVQPVFEAIVGSAAKLFEPCAATITMVKDGKLHWNATAALLPGYDIEGTKTIYPIPFDPSRSPTARAILERRVIEIPDTEALDTPELTRRAAAAGGFRAVTYVPLIDQDRGIGAILFNHPQPGFKFSDRQLALARTFADQAVIAIQNARLFNETKEALERQTATSDILKVIASSPSDVQPVFEAIASSANRLIGGFSTAVYRVIDDVVHLVAFTPTNPESDAALKAAFPVYRSELPNIPLMQNGVTAQIADSEAADPRTRQLGRARGWRSITFTPLMNRGEFIGFISSTRRDTGMLADHYVQLLRTFADQAVIAIENTRLFNETQEALERQTATADILRVIASSPSDVQPVFEAIAERSNRLLGGRASAVYSLVDNVQHLMAFTPTNPEADATLKSMFPRPISEVFWAEAILEGEIVRIADAEVEPNTLPSIREVARLRGWRSALLVPLIRDRKSIGVISVTRAEPGPFADHQVQLLKTFADQAVIAIENVRLFNETREALERQTATADILKVIASSPSDVQPVFEAIAQSAARLCQAEFCNVFRFDGEFIHYMYSCGYSREAIEALRQFYPMRPGRGSCAGRAILNGKAEQVPDVRADPDYDQGNVPDIMKISSIAAVPMLKEGRPVGAITLVRTAKGTFPQRQIDLLKTFADQAVIAIENTRLFNETREALERQTATSDILKVIASSPSDTQPVFDAIANSAQRLLAGLSATVFLFIDGMAHLGAFTPTTPEADDSLRSTFPRPAADFAPIEMTQRGEVVQVQDTEVLTDQIKYLARARGYRSMVFAPLMNKGAAIGFIAVTRVQPSSFTDHHVQLLKTFADQAVIAIDNVRLFEEVQARTRDLEESLQQQTATSEVLQIISSSPSDLAPVFEKILENATRVCGAEFGSMNLVEGDAVRQAALYNAPPVFAEVRVNRVSHPHPQSLLATAIRTKQVAHHADLRATPGYLDRSPSTVELVELGGARTVVVVPMLREDQVIGVITIFRQEIRSFDDKQIELVSNFAKQAVIAIENTRLLKELRQRTIDLSKSLEDLRTAQGRLIQTEKLASLGQLTAGIAHEIKNPLNFVNNFAALSVELSDELKDVLRPAVLDETLRLEVDDLTRTLKDNLGKVVQHGKRADSIVKNMLLHSREGSGEHRPADVNALVDESLNLAYHGARAEKPHFNVTLERDFDPAAGSADVFPQEITRVLLNLISNGFYAVTKRKAENGAADFEPTVRATTLSRGEHVEIRIRDNGTGIPEHVRERMFNPFFTTKPAGEGTGLGLSMSHDIIVKQHGGSIEVETEPGAFTEFRVLLPRISIGPGKAGGTG